MSFRCRLYRADGSFLGEGWTDAVVRGIPKLVAHHAPEPEIPNHGNRPGYQVFRFFRLRDEEPDDLKVHSYDEVVPVQLSHLDPVHTRT